MLSLKETFHSGFKKMMMSKLATALFAIGLFVVQAAPNGKLLFLANCIRLRFAVCR